jgi:hypothetical protein
MVSQHTQLDAVESEEANDVQNKLFFLAQQEQDSLDESGVAKNPELLRNSLYQQTTLRDIRKKHSE